MESFEIPGASLLKTPHDASKPEFGDSEYLQSIGSHIREIVALDNRFGGVDLVKLSARFFRTLHNQLGAGTYDPRLERDLQSAAGEMAEVAWFSSALPCSRDLVSRLAWVN